MSRRMLALAACWVLVNAASITHSAWSFAQLERAGWWWVVGVVAAVGTDAGMAALTWLAMERRREQRPFGWPVLGVLIAGGAVAYANVDHALGVVGTWATLTWWVRSRVLVLSLILPSLTVLMSALVEHEQAGVGAADDEYEPTPVQWMSTWPVPTPPAPAVVLTGEYETYPPIPVREGARDPLVADLDALTAARAHVAAHGFTTDAEVSEATGVPRSTVGRWRRAGMLTSAPTAERAARNGQHAAEVDG